MKAGGITFTNISLAVILSIWSTANGALVYFKASEQLVLTSIFGMLTLSFYFAFKKQHKAFKSKNLLMVIPLTIIAPLQTVLFGVYMFGLLLSPVLIFAYGGLLTLLAELSNIKVKKSAHYIYLLMCVIPYAYLPLNNFSDEIQFHYITSGGIIVLWSILAGIIPHLLKFNSATENFEEEEDFILKP